VTGHWPDWSPARAAGRSDIEYLGRLEPAGVMAAMRRSAVVVVPSVWDEVCPMVAIEALANGRPVLGTRRGGLPWLIGATGELGDAGWLVEPDVSALSSALPSARAEAAGRSGTGEAATMNGASRRRSRRRR
jgi:glycosyltransferase involved in cell wall biosynthesis